MKIPSPQRILAPNFMVQLLSLTVFLYGLVIFIDVLGIRLIGHHVRHTNDLTLSFSLIAALSLIYLSTRLRRRKQTAYWVTLAIYSALACFNTIDMLTEHEPFDQTLFVRRVLIPALLIIALIYRRQAFRVRGGIQSFKVALRSVVLVLLITFAYGTSGFLLLDMHDFHHEISVEDAAHRTIDQLGLTTADQLIPYTRRAKLFQDSLSVVSVASLAYVAISLFRPLQIRYNGDKANHDIAQGLLDQTGNDSEEFFKLWPHDKHYYFTDNKSAGLAYKVRRGVALVVADPFGRRDDFSRLLDGFVELCEVNDWQVAFVHISGRYKKLYRDHGFSLQKIGEEAVIDLAAFIETGSRSKYFRQIHNKFTKYGYTTELLQPPHAAPVITRLKEVSDAWLTLPGRAERGFMLGYFSQAYMQQCPVMVLRDEHGVIQAFINQIPSYDKHEANFDLLRSTTVALGNSNDYLLMCFAKNLHESGIRRLNAGLCPLSGLENVDDDRTVIDNALQFVYSNGDRFYSFSGLRRFKAKYNPSWSDRYVAYSGGIPGFSRAISALTSAMKVK